MPLLVYLLLAMFITPALAAAPTETGSDLQLSLQGRVRVEPPASAGAKARPDWQDLVLQSWVLKVNVVHTNGSQEVGSAVVVAPEQLVTNCHVLRDASQITVSRGKNRWPAHVGRGDAYRDLCFLDVPGLTGKPPVIAPPQDARVGTKVVAAGYSGGYFAANPGVIKGLFTCACDGGKVIQTSTYFDPGASGGGLFDMEGRLHGILTFKAMSGGNFHFAVPTGWLGMLNQLPSIAGETQGSFWESPGKASGYFLAACDLSARQQWHDLLGLSKEWSREEASNPQAWVALGRAYLGLGKPENAATGFQQALFLDSTHAEALWELQKLEIDLGRTLTGTE